MNEYAGIGSRSTPLHVRDVMKELAHKLAAEGWTLRSGHAYGADYAFELGAAGRAELYLPSAKFNSHLETFGKVYERPELEAFQISSVVHPSWMLLSDFVMRLHARNAHQILGPKLKTPSRFVVCWTPDGATKETTRATGGTGQAIRIAALYEIPVFNLQRDDHYDWVNEYIRSGAFAL